MADNLPNVVENLANSHESIGDSPIDLDDGDIQSEDQNGGEILAGETSIAATVSEQSCEFLQREAPADNTCEASFDKKEAVVTHTDASDVSSNDLSGPEDGECDSDEERGRVEYTKTHYRQIVKVRPPINYPPPPVESVPLGEHKADFDLPLEDISPERDTGDLEEVQDPYTDFVPPEAQADSPVNKFSEDSSLEKRKFKKKKEKKKRRRDSEGRKSKDDKKRKYSEEERYVGSPISSGPDNLDNTSPIGDSPISSGEDNWTAKHKPSLKPSDKIFYKQPPPSLSIANSGQRNLSLPKPTPAGSGNFSATVQPNLGQQSHSTASAAVYSSNTFAVASATSFSSTSAYHNLSKSYSGQSYSLSGGSYSAVSGFQISSAQTTTPLHFSVPPPNLR